MSKTKLSAESKPVLLLVDDEEDVRATLALVFKKDFSLLEAGSGQQALSLISAKKIDVVLCDIRMPGLDGLETLTRIKKIAPTTEVIMHTAIADTSSAVKATKLGAYEYIVKPADHEQLKLLCLRAAEKKELVNKTQVLSARLERLEDHMLGKMIGKSPAMKEVFKKVTKLANSDVSVLITGETGTGKELVAQAIHSEGSRREKPFIAINCGGIPAELLESELFGHEKGSFTSAEATRIGKFELADGGTIFLDEIGNMPKIMQAKILRVLQEREIERVGSAAGPIKVNVRVIAATNENLPQMIEKGVFREDLFHRLNVVNIQLPPLRERSTDIDLLADYFFDKYNKLYNGPFLGIAKETKALLRSYRWPGNIREMQHLFQRIITLEDGDEILPVHLPLEIFASPKKNFLSDGKSLNEMVGEYEKDLIIQAMERFNNNIQKVADYFNVHRSTLSTKIKIYNIK